MELLQNEINSVKKGFKDIKVSDVRKIERQLSKASKLAGMTPPSSRQK